MQKEIFQRTILLLGEDVFDLLSRQKIIIFGVGGVGSWCAESLVRSGVKELTIVDSDTVAVSNINRQLPATTATVGLSKVEVLKKHFQTINPEVNIQAIHARYTEETSASFHLDQYDYIVDAIDSLKDKAHLIKASCTTSATLFSSMGAALKADPTQIKTAEFWKVSYDPLARALRQRFKKEGAPSRKFTCVYSEERLRNQFPADANGTLMPVTAVFGMTLASLIINELRTKS